MTIAPMRAARLRGSALFLFLLSAPVIAGFIAEPPAAAPQGQGGPDRIVAWNDLGMHCIDPDFSVFSILPPFNTINAQMMRNGELVTSLGALEVTYESVPDSGGSINTTSIGKTNFWSHVQALFGQSPPQDVGLSGNAMPGAGNVPQSMEFDPSLLWAQGEGIPLTPIDDTGQKQPYPLMKVTLRSPGGVELASTVTSVPNSQELLCSQCHASGSSPYARPAAGWIYHPNPLRDDRLNILRLHDEKNLANPVYGAALAASGYRASGLLDTVRLDGTSILCAHCHGSNALPGTGMPGISALTAAMHGGHADALTECQMTLDANPTRSACYTCHPGFDTQCLRGAMGTAVGQDGALSMDCQSCHGGMSEVGDPARVGWLEQQNCQNCHSGSATNNSGQIRYESAFDAQGQPRVPASNLFATDPDTPAPGFSLYRFSTGHGELQCSACHGPPHAILPTSVENDGVQNVLLQGHDGTLMECSVCHTNLEDDQLDDGPHGMHSTGIKWVRDAHKDAAEANVQDCRLCHGADDRGTVLSLAKTGRTYSTSLGTKTFFKGQRISCYSCHDGPDDDDNPSNHAPLVTDRTLSTPLDVPLTIALAGSDQDGDPLTYRVIDQPAPGAFGRLSNGTVGLSGSTATFYPGEAQGQATFTYAANDGDIDSNLGTITVNVGPPTCAGAAKDYGFGCGAASGIVPKLTVTGCPEPGGQVTFQVTGGRGGAFGIFVEGTSRAIRELGTGCVLRVGNVSNLSSIQMSPGGVGAGSASIPYTIPPQASGTLTFQVYVRDFSPGFIGTFTNAIEITVP